MSDHMHDDGNSEILDLSFGDGPAHRSLDDRLVAGRRALLRQRLLTGVAGLAVLAVVGTTYAVGSGGGDTAGLDPAAAPSDVAPTPEPAPADDITSTCVVTSAVAPDPGFAVPDPAPGGDIVVDGEEGTTRGSAGGGSSSGGGTDPAPPPLPDPADSGAPDEPLTATELPEGTEPGIPAGEPGVPPTTVEPATPATPGDAPSAQPGTVEPYPSAPVPPSGVPEVYLEGEPVECSDIALPDPGPVGVLGAAGTSGSAYTGRIADFDPDNLADPSVPATLSPDGELVTADGVTVERTVDNPLDLTAPDHSVGVVFELKGETLWGLAVLRATDEGCAQWSFEQVPAENAHAKSIDDWLTGDGAPDGFAGFLGDCDGGGAGYSSGYAGAGTIEAEPEPTLPEGTEATQDDEAGVTTGSDNPGGVDDTTGKP